MGLRGAVDSTLTANGCLAEMRGTLYGSFTPERNQDLEKLCTFAQTLSHHSFYNASVPDEKQLEVLRSKGRNP
jgi:hypothetical protein